MLNTIRYLYDLKKNERLEKSKLDELVNKKINHIVHHAYHNSPYYKDLFKRENINVHNIESVEDIKAIPLLSKASLQNNLKTMVTKNLEEMHVLQTSGTSSAPAFIAFDRAAMEMVGAMKIRNKLAVGIRPGDKWAIFVRESKKDAKQRQAVKGLLRLLSKHFFMKGLELKADLSNVAWIDEDDLTRLNKFNPTIIHMFPSYMKLLGQKIEEGAIDINPKLLLSNGELMDRGTREYLEDIYGTYPLDIYGIVEVNEIAWECKEHNGYHINSDCIHVELVDKDGEQVAPGERGELVVTSLYNFGMPIIRYRTGDFAVASDETCSCGRTLPLLERIEGRIKDSITLNDGRLISPYQFLAECRLHEIENIKWFQINQLENNKFLMQFIPKKASNQISDEIIDKMKAVLGQNIYVDTRCVNSIPREKYPSGKYSYVLK